MGKWRVAKDKNENVYHFENEGKLDDWLRGWKEAGRHRSGAAQRDKFSLTTRRVRDLLPVTKGIGTEGRPLMGREIVQLVISEFGIPYREAFMTVKRAVLRFDPESWPARFPRGRPRSAVK